MAATRQVGVLAGAEGGGVRRCGSPGIASRSSCGRQQEPCRGGHDEGQPRRPVLVRITGADVDGWLDELRQIVNSIEVG
ncbi:hypothetical protein QMK19_23515 [Streptomyces sp. H10-C2]|uniref:hypothetical protein n=1 Tax=unclassified Streptomyces TaxID=2593676 RepID=UPI0024B952F5|nr:MULTISPECIES: hypothetical protein [unclassified Streptomyces]MDJ0342738.1 hypothetical protein [Streptomyces sp. PH10-H1]MDJ0372552.1 hypothetical protein [Streptomyces sp. H10-C2]